MVQTGLLRVAASVTTVTTETIETSETDETIETVETSETNETCLAVVSPWSNQLNVMISMGRPTLSHCYGVQPGRERERERIII